MGLLEKKKSTMGSCLINCHFVFRFMQFKMRRDESCKVVCRRHLSQEAAKNFKEKIDDEYRVNMYGFSLQLIPYSFSMSV